MKNIITQYVGQFETMLSKRKALMEQAKARAEARRQEEFNAILLRNYREKAILYASLESLPCRICGASAIGVKAASKDVHGKFKPICQGCLGWYLEIHGKSS